MNIAAIQTLWPETSDFHMIHKDTGGDTVFVYFHTPAILYKEGKEIHTPAGTVVIFDRYKVRNFGADDESFLHDWMRIREDLTNLMKKCNLEFETPYTITDNEFISEIMQKLELENLKSNIFYDDISESLVKELFFKISRAVYGKESTESKDEKLLSAMMRTRKIVLRRYDGDWGIERMAKLTHISPSYFYILYKQFFGISPKQDLLRVRIEHSKQFLLQKKYSVREIASMVGYENEYYFIRKFKEVTGTTPGKYKHYIVQNNVSLGEALK